MVSQMKHHLTHLKILFVSQKQAMLFMSALHMGTDPQLNCGHLKYISANNDHIMKEAVHSKLVLNISDDRSLSTGMLLIKVLHSHNRSTHLSPSFYSFSLDKWPLHTFVLMKQTFESGYYFF